MPYRLKVLLIRLALGIFFALLLSRMFFPATDMVTILAAALLLTGFAYLFEHLRKK